MHIDLLKKILMSKSTYWVIAFKNKMQNCGRTERLDDEIVILGIPPSITIGLAYEEIRLLDIEKLYREPMNANVYLSTDYAPFQHGRSMYEAYDGFPIEEDVRIVFNELIKAKKSNSLYDYKKIMQEINEEIKSKLAKKNDQH